MAQTDTYSPTQTASVGQMRLDDIYAVDNLPRRWAMVEAWVAAGEGFDIEDDRVLLRTADGKPRTYDFLLGGKKFYVDQKGRRVKRSVAVALFDKYGPGGQYLGLDQSSCYSPSSWTAFKVASPDMAQIQAEMNKAAGIWPDGKPQYITSPLTHVMDEDEAEKDVVK